MLDLWQEVGLFDFSWQQEILPLSCSSSISLEYLQSIHPFICGDNRAHGFFVRFAWGFAQGRTIKARIKARNNYSGLCVGEWQQWKAHCQLCTPAVAREKYLKAKEDEDESRCPPRWASALILPSMGTANLSPNQNAQICSIILPGWKFAWPKLCHPLPKCECSWGWTVYGVYTGLTDWQLNAGSWQ